MTNMIAEIENPATNPDVLADRNRTLAIMFKTGEQVWIADEEYLEESGVWRMDIVRRGANGAWMRQRYNYEVVTKVVYFRGERAISDEERTNLRHEGKVFQVPTA